MRIPRIYQPASLNSGELLSLTTEAAHHVANVLRLQVGQPLTVFNGEGDAMAAVITTAAKRKVEVRLGERQTGDAESVLQLTLVQAISRGNRMDITLQKAVELGVSRFVPVHSEFSNVRLDAGQRQKKHEHWQRIIIAACEQCGRNRLPELFEPQPLADWLAHASTACKLVLHPRAASAVTAIQPPPAEVMLLAGPEGGFSDSEVAQAIAAGYRGIRLGPRILRTETAALVALTVCQTLWGDLRQGE